MKLTIDNLDGQGAVDYSGAVDGSEPLVIERILNAPSTAKGLLCLEGSGLATPARRGRVVIAADAGTLLFTGYLTTEPVAVYAGMASAGPVYRLAFSAVSDEWLLDKQSAGSLAGLALEETGAAALTSLVSRLDAGLLSTSGLTAGRKIGVFVPEVDAAWSAHAGAVAGASYGAYRVLGSAVGLTEVGAVVHALGDSSGTLAIAGLKQGSVKELANDVTLSGATEPAGYWTELFTGDGTTVEFDLTGEPAASGGGHEALIDDTFSAGSIDLGTWEVADPGSHFSLGGGGLTLGGGNGFDGQTTLTANDPLELGGTLVVELDNVVLTGASDGVIAGLYSGATATANLVAGFNIRQSGGNTLATPLINGVEVGSSLTVVSGHAYTLRLRVNCAELIRVKQQFYALVNGAVEQFGGGFNNAGLSLVFEARDVEASSNTPVTVLYDGSITSSPAQVNFVAVNSVQLFGSIGAVMLTRTGSGWVRSTNPTTGTVSTRLIGKAGEGVDCTLTSSVTGKVTFLAGQVPVAGETVTVSYRGRRQSVARVADVASIATEAAGGGVGTARWVGHVSQPAARTSEDCENAAAAVLSFASDRAAAVSGSYTVVNPGAGTLTNGDVWPGDVLALTANGSTANLIVRTVSVEEQGASPEALTYRIGFANDWAEGLGLKLSEAIAKTALLPALALDSTKLAGRTIANLPQLTVVSVSGTGASDAVNVDAGTAPPNGGGFEVRRRDSGFGTGLTTAGSGDLVLRSPVRGFSIPRSNVVEEFYVRMYDGSTPPLYSRESSVIVTHVALG